jgi:hypothetical protein
MWLVMVWVGVIKHSLGCDGMEWDGWRNKAFIGMGWDGMGGVIKHSLGCDGMGWAG